MAGLRSSTDVFDPDYVPPSKNAPAVLPGVDPNTVEPLPQAGPSEFQKGLTKATLGLRGDLYSAAEAAGQAAGQEDLQQWGAEGAQQAYEEASAVPAGNVESIFDVQSVQDFTDWAAHGLGQLAPFALSMVATGATGALATGALRAATLARGISAVDKVRKLTAAQKAGGLAGGYLGSAVPSAGTAYHDLKQEGVINPGAAALEGGIIGLLDIAPAHHLLNIMGGRRGGMSVMKGVLEQAPAEAITEAAQEGVSEGFRQTFIPGYESDDLGKRLIEAASLGALGGGFAGGVSGGVGGALGRVRKDTAPLPGAKAFAASEGVYDTGDTYDPNYEDWASEDAAYNEEQATLGETDLPTFDRTEFGLQVPVAPNLTLTREAKQFLGMSDELVGDDSLGRRLEVLNRPYLKQGAANKNVIAHQLNQVAEQIDRNANYPITAKGEVAGLQIPDSFAELLVPEETGAISGYDLTTRLVEAQMRLSDAQVEQPTGPFQRETLYDRAQREAEDKFPDAPDMQRDYMNQQGEKLFRKRTRADEQDQLDALLRIPISKQTPKDKSTLAKLRAKVDAKRAPYEDLYDPQDPASFLHNFEGSTAPPLSDIHDALREGGLDADTEKAYRDILANNRNANLDFSLDGLDLGTGEKGLNILKSVTKGYKANPEYGYFVQNGTRVNMIKLVKEARRQRWAQEKVYKSGDKPKEEHGSETEIKRLFNDVMLGLGMLAERGDIKLPEGTGPAVALPGVGVQAGKEVAPTGQKAFNQLVNMVGVNTVVDSKGRTFGQVVQAIATKGKKPRDRKLADKTEYGMETVDRDRQVVTGMTHEEASELSDKTEAEFNENIRQGEDQFLVGKVEKFGEIESAREEDYVDWEGYKRVKRRVKVSEAKLERATAAVNAMVNKFTTMSKKGAPKEQIDKVVAEGLEARKVMRRAQQEHAKNNTALKDFTPHRKTGLIDMEVERTRRLRVLRRYQKSTNNPTKLDSYQKEIDALEAGEIEGTYLEVLPQHQDLGLSPPAKPVRRGEEHYTPPPVKLTKKQIEETKAGIAAQKARAALIDKQIKDWDKPKKQPALMDRKIKWKMSRGAGLRSVTAEQLVTMEHAVAKKLFTQYTKLLKAPKGMKFMTSQEVLDYASNESIDKILAGTMHGFKTNLPDGSIGIYVHPATDEAHARQVLAHEIGHAVYEGFIEGTTDGTARAIMQEYMAWRTEFGKDTTKLKDLLNSKKPLQSALAAMGNSGERTLAELHASDVEYHLDFEEWFADRVSQWFETTQQPKTVVEKFFAGIANLLKRIAKISPKGTVDSLMDSIVGGEREWNLGNTSGLREARATGIPEDVRNLVNRISRKSFENLSADELLYVAAVHEADPYGAEMHRAFRHWLMRDNDEGLTLTGETNALINKGQLKVKNLLMRTAMSDNIQRQLRTLLKHDRRALQELAEPDVSAAYMFQLWKAGLIKVGDRTDTHFHQIAKTLRDSLGVVSDSTNAEKILQQLADGTSDMTVEGRRTAVQRILPDSIAKSVVDTMGPVYDKAMKPMRSLFFTIDNRVRATGNTHLIEIADIMHTPAGRHNSNPTMWTMKQEYMARFENIARRIFEGKDAQFGNEALEYLYEVRSLDDAPPGTQRVIKNVRKLFRMMYDYQVDAGVDVKDIGENYFPWVFDQEVLAFDLEGLRTVVMQEKYRKNRLNLAKYVNVRDNLRDMAYQYEGIVDAGRIEDALRNFAETGVWTLVEAYPMNDIYTYNTISDYMLRNAYTSGQGEVDVVPSKGVPAMRFSNPRLFKFVDPAEIRPYLSNDLGQTIGRYISQAVKHAEFVRRFGEDAQGLRHLLRRARDTGASEKEIELAKNYVRASLGTYGRETAEFLNRHFGVKLPKYSWTPINEKLNKAMGVGIVYQNLRYLGLATLTSLGDVMGIAVRSSEMSSVYRGIKSYLQRNKNDLSDLAEMLGVIEHSQISDALGWRYDGMYLTGGARKLNDSFFKLIGLESWTRATRLMGLSTAQSFIVKHATRPTKHSERWLQELNLTSEDVLLNNEGRLKVLTTLERKRASEAELARDDRVRSALIQFTDEAILRPNASMRTLWGSDPHYQLFQYLKSFMYTFHERILKRVGHEAMEGNYATFIHLLSYIPVMIVADLMRETIQFGPDGDPRKDGWGFWDHVEHGAVRAGLLGYAQQGLEINNDMNMGGYGFGGFAATFDTLADIPDLWSSESGAQIGLLPGQTIYREWLN